MPTQSLFYLRWFVSLGAVFGIASCVMSRASATNAIIAPDALAASQTTTFTLLELSDPATAVFQATGEQFQRRLTLNFNAHGKTDLLRIELSKLDGADGIFVEPRLSRLDESDVGSKGQGKNWVEFETPTAPVEFIVSAPLPRIGDYTGYLRFKLGDQVYQNRPIRVTRAPAVEVPSEVSTLQKVSGSASELSLTFSVKGAIDQDLTLRPGVFELALKGAGIDKLNPSYKNMTFTPSTVVVPKANMTDFVLTFKDLSPGEYSGKLMLASPPYIPKQQNFNFSVRRSWACAFFLIALGAGVSLFLKYMSSRTRPRIVIRAAVAKIFQQGNSLQQAYKLDAVEIDTLEIILSRVSIYYEQAFQIGDISTGWVDTARQAIEREGEKLAVYPRWLNARRALASIMDLDETHRTELDGELNVVRAALVSDTPLELSARTSLSFVVDELARIKLHHAQNVIGETERKLTDTEGAAQAPSAQETLRHARSEVELAKRRLNDGDFNGFKNAYDNAGLAYFQALSLETLSLIDRTARSVGDAARAPTSAAVPTEVSNHLTLAANAGDLQTARVQYFAALAGLGDAQGNNSPDKALSLASSALGADIPNADAFPALAWIPKLVVEDIGVLTRQIRTIDIVVDVAAVLSAGVLGVVLVWGPNPGWGQWPDLFAALLWGLGLYSIGTQTLGGISAMRSKLLSGGA